ncbi:unnamed protein product [Lymnaea stagnalis]|uniref:Uncharacterized protein n=1 Tax=Lymnaea stagnalis TaxID=6523 RepID=A0AAV2I599_LYMST
MKLLVCVLLLAVTVDVGYAVDCSGVTKCYGADAQDRINRKNQDYDYGGACREYAKVLQCLNSAGVAGCETVVKEQTDLLVNQTTQFCLPDGSLTGCGYDVNNCMQEALNILQDFKNNNASMACPAITQFAKCSDGVKNANECPQVVLDGLNALHTALSSDQMLSGCDGPCAQAIGVCTKGLVADVSGPSLIKTNWKDFCKNAYMAVNCTKALETNGACVGNDQEKVFRITLAGIVGYLTDYCDANGNPSDCVKGLDLCNGDLLLLSQQDLKGQCKSAAEFLECSSNLPCEQQLGSVIQGLRNGFQTQERAQSCPTVGSCSDRLIACQSNDAALQSINKNTGDPQFCKIVTNAVTCFDFVRNDPICSKENFIVSEFETAMAVDAAPECGATIGDCTDRLKICADSERILAAVDNTTQKDLFCNRTRRGVACFDKVRRNPNCTVDKVEVSQWESKLRNFVAPFCGGASVVHIPLLLIVACVLVSVNQVFLPFWDRTSKKSFL